MIELINISKFYPGNEKPGINNVSLNIQRGEILVLVGSSGSGKTTLLKMLNRLEEPTSGAILINGKDIKSYNVNELRRGFFGYVFQKIGLFPHMTVKENIEIVLRLDNKPIIFREKKVRELLDFMRLSPNVYGNRYINQLSGGEQQRVGVARALATDSECLLMDEPFGALDAVTRCELQDEILRLKENLKKTIIFVTHDISEAFKLGDRIGVMQNGNIEQLGTKEQLCEFPKTPFVEQLMRTGFRT
ncbi:MAG: ATP-binding cassette domain-containing protein [Proteobacteria bacterium]|nr:ATP-binding cassette domain-containing protein [Pseudomonadota bacterium]